MKLSISNIAWEKDQDQEMYEYLSQIGYDAIEIAPTRILGETPYDKIQEAEVFAKELEEKYNLKISSMQSIWFGKTEKIFGTVEERKELLKYTKKAIDFAQKIKCRNLVFGCPKNRNIKKPEDYKIAIQFFRQIGEYAEKNNTVFAIEPNPTIYNTNFINLTEEAIKIVKDIDCKAVKVNLDFGTIIANEEDIFSILESNMDEINHIHISEPNLEVIKQREAHKKLAEKLKENKYENYISIEMKKGNDIEKIKEILNYIGEVFK